MNAQVLISISRILSDEDDEGALDWLPMAPEIEDPEEPGWGQLEVSGYAIPTYNIVKPHNRVSTHTLAVYMSLVLYPHPLYLVKYLYSVRYV